MEELIDLASERLVLSGIFRYGGEIFLDILDLMNEDTFSDASNRAIWRCLKYLYDEKEIGEFDQASVLAIAPELGLEFLTNQPDEIRHLASIFHTRVVKSNVVKWAAKLRKLQIARLIRTQLADADLKISQLKGTEPIEQILGIAEDAVLDFSSILNDDESRITKRFSVGLDEWFDYVEQNPTDTVGISSGWPYYDHAIGGGFRRGTISLVGARPKTGKSSVALNVGLNVATRNTPILLLDTEMKTEDHWPRALACLSKKNGGIATINHVERGQFVTNQFMKNKLVEAKKEIHEMPFHYRSVIGLSIEETLPVIRQWLHKEVGYDENGKIKDCLIIYDYLKLQTSGNLSDSLKEYQLMGFSVTTMHNFVGRFDVPMLAFIQLNRDGQTQETGAVLAQSDRIGWIVTNFCIFKPKTQEEIAEGEIDQGNRKMVPVYARHGEGLREGDYINMHFQKRHALITEGNTRDNVMRARCDEQNEIADLDDPVGDEDGQIEI